MQDDQCLYKIEEVSEKFKCAPSTIWRWIALGDFPKPLKIGGTSRCTSSAISGVIEAAQRNQDNHNHLETKSGQRNRPRRIKLSRERGKGTPPSR